MYRYMACLLYTSYRIIQPHNIEAGMISEANWVIRSRYQSGKDIGISVKPGDICYIEFGQSYLNEMGYQHFGLVVSCLLYTSRCV